MEEKERFTTTINGELLRQVRILAINEKRTTNKLIEEGLKDLLKKYEKKTKKQSLTARVREMTVNQEM